ncbi:hypothetical protein [Pannonibacter phragmitetus]|uniref:hypothetical protein n=1 Tax=Pannonibacter phragmitetus TaxID=121719 RepID=UPI0013CE6469|nr:hypothetical protein [Pannonibacter phragmitetus]
MTRENQRPWLRALCEETRYLVIRRLLQLAGAAPTVTMHLYRAGLVSPAGVRTGFSLAGKAQRAAILLLRAGRRRNRNKNKGDKLHDDGDRSRSSPPDRGHAAGSCHRF